MESFSPEYSIFALFIIMALVGAFYGGFCAKIVYRLSRGHFKGLAVFSPSFCPNCGRPLSFVDKLPLVSYLHLKGRCRRCQEKISARYFIFELTGMVLPLFLFWYENYSVYFVLDYVMIMSLLVEMFICKDTGRFSPTVTFFLIIPGLILTAAGQRLLVDQLEGAAAAGGLIIVFLLFVRKKDIWLNYLLFSAILGFFFGLYETLILFGLFIILLGLERIYMALESKAAVAPGVFLAAAGIIEILIGKELLEWITRTIIFIIS